MRQSPIHVRDLWRDYTTIEGEVSEPRVSVILPTFRRASSGLLQRAVDSVLRQTFSEFELILIDDGSTDGTADYLIPIARQDRRVRYFRFARNSGLPGVAVNFGIAHSRAPVLAFMFDDDLWYPNALADLYAEISKPERHVVYGKVRVFYRSPSSGNILWTPLGDTPISRSALLRRSIVSNNAVMLRKEVLSYVGMYDPHVLIRRLTDWDLWRRVTRKFTMFQVDSWVGEIWGPASPDSLGITVRPNWDTMAKYMVIERDERLKPGIIDDFVVNDFALLDSNFSRLDMPMVHEVLREYYAQVSDIANSRAAEMDLKDSLAIDTPARPKIRLLLSRMIFDSLPQIYFLNYLESQTGSPLFSYRFAGELEMKFLDIVGCDVLILVRTVTENALRALRAARALGKKVVYFIDDNFLRLSEDFEPSVVRQLLGDKTAFNNFKRIVSESDLVVVSNELIASDLRSLNKNTYVLFPNVSDHYLANSGSSRQQRNGVKIGHVGTDYRKKEFKLLAPAIRRVSDELGEKAFFEFWGIDLSKIIRNVSNFKYRPYVMDYAEYLDRLCSAEFDILLTPLLATPYRNCKSYIKYLETAAAGAAGIYSNTPVFEDVVNNGQTGLLVNNNPEDWADAILQLARDQDLRARIIEHSREDVRRHYTTEATRERFNKIFEIVQPNVNITYPGLLLSIAELLDRKPDLLTGQATVGNFPGAKLVRAGELFHPIEIALVSADRLCELGARVLRIKRG